jgi:hypothetical protein
MGQFRRFLSEAALKELHLNGWLFTWSNERDHPTLERIDREFVSAKWDALPPHQDLQSLSSLCSNHTPLLLSTDCTFVGHKRFIFKFFWLCCTGFMDAVKLAW